MSDLKSSSNRKEQIVDATLELLADTPVDQLTTRQIAEQLGLSQPALFRHFRTREQIVLAVVARTRAQMGAIAESILEELDDPLEQLEELARRIAGRIEESPGLPRLLFQLPKEGEVHDALRLLVNMLSALVAELFREGQRRGTFSAAVDPENAATLFVGLIQGLALRARLDPHDTGLENDARALMALWLNGTRERDRTDGTSGSSSGAESESDGILAIDVRPILEGGLDPLTKILESLGTLAANDVLAITAPFRPGPLLALLQQRGHGVSVREAIPGIWSVHVVVGGAIEIIDLTDLEPPEPLEQVLLASAKLVPGGVYLARLPRFPRLLIGRLQERDQAFAVHQDTDGTTLIRLRRQGS